MYQSQLIKPIFSVHFSSILLIIVNFSKTNTNNFIQCLLPKQAVEIANVNIPDETDTPVLYKAISHRFKRYFNAARIVKPTLDDYKFLGMEDSFFDTPLLFVLLPEVKEKKTKETQDMGFSAVVFETKKMGDLNYPNILRYLFGVNNSYRHTLPGDNQSNLQEVAEMLDIVNIESKRFEVEKAKSRPVTDDNNIKFTMSKTVRDEL